MIAKKPVISSETLHSVITSKKNKSGGVFTLLSVETGTDYTYKISRTEYRGKWYTHVKVETGYMEFSYLGHYFRGHVRRKGKIIDSPTAVAISFVLRKVEQGMFDWLDERMEIMHTGKCLSCGRTLTDAESIKRGVGPVCAGIQ